MAEATTKSRLATVVDCLDGMTDSELRQLQLIIGVRLGKPTFGASAPVKSRGTTSRASVGNPGGTRKPKIPRRMPKGNPSRKSQWASHPLYAECARLKKVVTQQSKETKLSFNAVDTDESRQYREALSQWLEAKSSFRGYKTTSEGSVDEGSTQAGKKTPFGRGKQSVAAILGGKSSASWADEVNDFTAKAASAASASVPASAGNKATSPPPAIAGGSQGKKTKPAH